MAATVVMPQDVTLTLTQTSLLIGFLYCSGFRIPLVVKHQWTFSERVSPLVRWKHSSSSLWVNMQSSGWEKRGKAWVQKKKKKVSIAEFLRLSGAAVAVLSLENHKADHDRDQADWSYHQGEDDDWWRVTQLLCGTVLEKFRVNVHKGLFHQRVGPWDQETVGHLLCASA